MAAPRRPGRRISLDIGDAVHLVFNEHRLFMSGNAAHADPDLSKIFAGRHNAGRAAISHLEALFKLQSEMTPPRDDHHGATLAQARAALAAETSENSTHDPEAEE